MNIAIVTEHYPPHLGGVEAVFQAYARGLAGMGLNIRVITSTSNGHQLPYRDNVVTVYPVPSISLFNHPLLRPRSAAEHVQWADLVHTTTYTAAITAHRLSVRYRKPCLLTVHEVIGHRYFTLDPNPARAALLMAAEKFIVTRPFTHWHTVSDSTSRDLKAAGISPSKITRIYNGLDHFQWRPDGPSLNLAKRLNLPLGSRIILYTGRAGLTKGVHDVIKAVQLVHSRLTPDIFIGLLIPDNPTGTHRQLARRLARLRLNRRVVIGPAATPKDLPALRRDAFAGLVPSRTEGFGLSAAEWSRLGKPLICSTAGALPEVAGGRVLFFPPGDIGALAQALLDADQGAFVSRPIPGFSWPKSVLDMHQLYMDVISASQTGSLQSHHQP